MGETLQDATGVVTIALTSEATAALDNSVQAAETTDTPLPVLSVVIIEEIATVLDVAHVLSEISTSPYPALRLGDLARCAARLRDGTAHTLDRELKAQYGISWLNVLRAANTMRDP